MSVDEVDVRDVPKPQRHPLIFDRFTELDVGSGFTLINNHDPKHLRQEFERDHAGQYGWEYLESGPTWRIRITKLTASDRPRVLCNTSTAQSAPADAAGAIWTLEPRERQLDANLIRLRPGGRIERHLGPDLDVLLVVVAGSGKVATAGADVPLTAGDVVWLPRRSERAVMADAAGLSYLTVHPRRPALGVSVR